jgi:hypothetical protein
MRKAFLALLSLCILVSIFQLTVKILEHSQHQSSFLGNQFNEIAPAFKNVRKAGYYTDKNIEHILAIAQFEQAQYVLAPTILDLNNTQHPLVIFDCTTPQVAMQKINELGLKPLKMNSAGIILAFNPKTQELNP